MKKPTVTKNPESIANSDHSVLGWVGFCLICAFFSGCAALPDKPVRPAVYDFGPGLVVKAAPAPAAPLPTLALADIDAPPAIDGSAVLFRLAYADVQQLRPYAQARWSMPPAQLVRQRLREQLSQQRVVLNPGEGAASMSLRLELEEFTQVFETPERSIGLVRLRATLVEGVAGRERIVAQRRFVTQRPAPSADAAGGVRALTAATDAAIEEIAQWLQQLPAPAR
jgi:cholesterol transport system auxiliary component